MSAFLLKILGLLQRRRYGLNPELAERDATDPRNFQLGAAFGTIDIKDVPAADFYVGPENKVIKNQITSDFCTGFGTSYAQDAQEGIVVDPLYQFMAGKKISGDWRTWGNGFNAVLKGAVIYGSLVQTLAPFTLQSKSRDFLANPDNWPTAAFEKATYHAKRSYFKVSGPYDLFDNFRAALWQNRIYKRLIITGAMWRPNWLSAPGGVITRNEGGPTGHLFAIDGQKMINGEPQLRIINSYGPAVGDRGYFYMNRQTANRELIWGGYMLVDIERPIAEILNRYNNKMVAVKGTDQPAIYLVREGKKQQISSMNVYNALGFEDKEGNGGYEVIDPGDLEKIPSGPALAVKDLPVAMQQLFHRNKIVS